MRRLLVLAAALAACTPSGDAPATGPEAAGRAYFRQARCVSCHRIGAEGSAVGPDLTLAGFRHKPEWLDLYLSDPRAWNPRTLMPNPRFSAEARKAVVAYLSGLKGRDWPKGGRPWDAPSLMKDPAERGKVLYARAGCAACHGPDRKGGYPNNNVAGKRIPALDRVKESYSKAELVDKIRRGVPHPLPEDPKMPAPLVAMPAWGSILDDAELDAVAAYLLESSAAPDDSGW